MNAIFLSIKVIRAAVMVSMQTKQNNLGIINADSNFQLMIDSWPDWAIKHQNLRKGGGSLTRAAGRQATEFQSPRRMGVD